jgi:hypothetical protein
MLKNFNILKVLRFYSHIHAHLMSFDIATLMMAWLLAETCRGEERKR